MEMIAEFIPMVILLLLLSFSKKFIQLSHTSLGKLLAIIIIIFYARFNKYVGLFVCTLVILYYNETDFYSFEIKEGIESQTLEDIQEQQMQAEKIQNNEEDKKRTYELEMEKIKQSEKEQAHQMEMEKIRQHENEKNNRIEVLQKIIESKDYSKSIKRKAQKELEELLLPTKDDEGDKNTSENFENNTTENIKYSIIKNKLDTFQKLIPKVLYE